MIELTANKMSALSSIIAGVLPAPTPKAGFPDEYAAFTIPGPPVAKIMSASLMISLVNSMDGTSIQPMIPFGAPAFTAASNTTFVTLKEAPPKSKKLSFLPTGLANCKISWKIRQKSRSIWFCGVAYSIWQAEEGSGKDFISSLPLSFKGNLSK